MKKSDLKTGMRALDRCGNTAIVLLNVGGSNDIYDICCFAENGDGIGFDSFNEDLTGANSRLLDIMAIYAPPDYVDELLDTTSKGELLWERPEPETMVTVDGKQYSESTLKKMIQQYVE